ncbi:PKD domain-containing protein [Thermoplasmatota archaeon]
MMNKKVICIIIFSLLITITFPLIESAEKIDKTYNKDIKIYENIDSGINSKINNINYDSLDQQQISDSGWAWAVFGSGGAMAQSFKPALGSLTKVELKLKKQGTPAGLTISIRSSLTGVDLTTIYKPGSVISTTASWYEFNFPDISVTPGVTYYIVWDPNGEDGTNNFFWRMGNSNPYSNGEAWVFLGSWDILDPPEVPDPDFCFKTYGSATANNPPYAPSQPSGPNSGVVGESYFYSTSSIDPDGDDIKYGWDWDGDNLVDEYSNLISSGNIDSRSHSWSYAGTYNIKVKAQDEHGALSGFSSALTVVISAENNPPNKTDTPSGATSGKTGTLYSYSTSATDPEGNQVYYFFDWGDGSNSGWIGPHDSGEIINRSHSWTSDGTYPVKVKAKDTYNDESVWSDPLSITMPRTKHQSLLNRGDFQAEIGLDGERNTLINLEGNLRNRGRFIIVNGIANSDEGESRFQGLFRGKYFILQVPINNNIINILGQVKINSDDQEFNGLWRIRSNRINGWIQGSFN